MALLLACRKSDGPDRWPDVEKLATPTVTAADGALLTAALERVTDDDVPEMALEGAIAWHKAGGGLPWRGGRAMDDRRIFRALKVGEALIERRPDNADATATALYLGQRLRAEGPFLIDVMIGFSLAAKAQQKLAGKPEYAAFAPTEAEARRAIPADATGFLQMMKETKADDPAVAGTIRKAYVEMLVDAPADRAGYEARIAHMVAKAEKSDVLRLVISPRLPTLTKEMFDGIDSYRAWAR